MPNAQETFKGLLRHAVAPRLRSLGFRGSGQTFELPSESHWVVLGFQRSAFSDATSVSFTVNLTVVAREEWKRGRAEWPNMPERPPANTGLPGTMTPEFPGYWHARIGSLFPDNRDRWWTVEAGAETHDVAEAVVAAIRELALPALLARMRARR